MQDYWEPLRAGAFFQPVVFEILGWSLAILAFVALLDDADRRWWIVCGMAAGLGGLTKFSAVIIVGGSVEELQPLFADVVEAGGISTPLGVEEEQEVPIHLCRGPREPMQQLWERLGPVWG